MISEYNIPTESKSNVQMIRGVQNRRAVQEESVEVVPPFMGHANSNIFVGYIRKA